MHPPVIAQNLKFDITEPNKVHEIAPDRPCRARHHIAHRALSDVRLSSLAASSLQDLQKRLGVRRQAVVTRGRRCHRLGILARGARLWPGVSRSGERRARVFWCVEKGFFWCISIGIKNLQPFLDYTFITIKALKKSAFFLKGKLFGLQDKTSGLFRQAGKRTRGIDRSLSASVDYGRRIVEDRVTTQRSLAIQLAASPACSACRVFRFLRRTQTHYRPSCRCAVKDAIISCQAHATIRCLGGNQPSTGHRHHAVSSTITLPGDRAFGRVVAA